MPDPYVELAKIELLTAKLEKAHKPGTVLKLTQRTDRMTEAVAASLLDPMRIALRRPWLPVVVDCAAVWCAPCDVFKPIVKAAAKALAGKALFYLVDVDKAEAFAKRHRIRSVPTLLVFGPAGSVVERSAGVIGEGDISELVAKAAKAAA